MTTFTCPSCNHENNIKVKENITNMDIKKIINDKFFVFTCKKCHRQTRILYPVKVETDKYLVYFTPSSDKKIKNTTKKIGRVCDTYEDFREKIMIFDANLNDVVIEYLKKFILNNIKGEIKDKVEMIRFDSLRDDKIFFYLKGVEEDAYIPTFTYYSLYDRMHLKKIRDCVNVDEFTYRKYYWMWGK